ncbi:unnamed protein product [Rhizopus microsporus]
MTLTFKRGVESSISFENMNQCRSTGSVSKINRKNSTSQADLKFSFSRINWGFIEISLIDHMVRKRQKDLVKGILQHL